MKNVNSLVTISIFVAFYYFIWVLTLPFYIVQLFLQVIGEKSVVFNKVMKSNKNPGLEE